MTFVDASRARAPVALFLLLALGCAAPDDARMRLYDLGWDDPVQEALRLPARMTVIFWPALGECMPTEMALMESLDEIRDAHPDVRFLTVVPDGSGESVLRYGRPLPGEVLRLDPEAYAAQLRLGPRPRVEVWSAERELLLLRSVPPYVPRAEALAEEIVWSLFFTEPVPKEEEW